jgi:hypothetical protein
MKVGTRKLPFFGGGYFRLTPYAITKMLSKQLDSRRAVFYMHPYELDTEELAAIKRAHDHIPLKWRISQFIGRGTVENKLNKLMNDFEFTSFANEYYSENSLSIAQTTSGNTGWINSNTDQQENEVLIATPPFSKSA